MPRDLKFTRFLGKHLLSGVDRDHTKIKDSWGEGYEDCETISFTIDDRTYVAVEDPSDGYRSSMGYLNETKVPTMNKFEPQLVLGRMRSHEEYESHHVLEFINPDTKEVILAVGTSNFDDYYPCWVAEWNPQNMNCNLNR